jgi:hypothetical protein
MSEIIKSIAAIMGEVGSVSKAGKNEFHRYAYATAADILHKLQPLMAREGLVVFQTEKERVMTDDGVLSVTYDFTIAHKSGEVWPTPITRTGMSSAKNSKGGFDDKCLNKCHTSAHKYFHLTLFEIPTGDYDDADEEEDRAPAARSLRSNVNGNYAPARPAAPPEPTAAEKATADEIEAAFDGAETNDELERIRKELTPDIDGLPEALKLRLRRVYGLKRKVLETFSEAAE